MRQLTFIVTVFLALTILFGLTNFSGNDNFIREQTDSSYKTTTLKKLQGTWFDEKIPTGLYLIIVRDSQWNIRCESCGKGQILDNIYAIEESKNNYYSIKITDKLPQYVDTIVKTEFIILTNKKDTSYYEILGLTDTTMSLMHYPSAKRQLYKKKK